LSDFVNYVDTSNRVDGKPIYYWINMSNAVVPSDAACIILVNCTEVLIQEFNLALSSNGIVLANTNSSIVNSNNVGVVNTAAFSGYGEPALNILLFSSFNNSVANNRANIYLTFSSENRVTQNTGIIRLDTSNSNEITENSITSISFVPIDHSGLVLSNAANNQIIANKVTANSVGIVLSNSPNNIIARNDVYGNSQGGIGCGDSKTRPTCNVIVNNSVTGNGNYGIRDIAYGTRIIGNSVVKNSNLNMQIGDSVNCILIGNIIEGFLLDGDVNGSPRNCSVIGNKIIAKRDTDQPSVWFLSDYPATFYHNNLPNVTVFRLSTQVSHKWDNGSQGNYWADYNGTDANGDGIGDVPYVIDANNQDNYPLMAPVKIDNIMEESPEWASRATEPFPALLITGVVMISIMIIVSVGIIYLKKRLRRTVPASTDSSSYK